MVYHQVVRAFSVAGWVVSMEIQAYCLVVVVQAVVEVKAYFPIVVGDLLVLLVVDMVVGIEVDIYADPIDLQVL